MRLCIYITDMCVYVDITSDLMNMNLFFFIAVLTNLNLDFQILDTNQLIIVSVINADSLDKLTYNISPAKFGSKLEISIPQCCSQQ